jgi:hypothetical protein
VGDGTGGGEIVFVAGLILDGFKWDMVQGLCENCKLETSAAKATTHKNSTVLTQTLQPVCY